MADIFSEIVDNVIQKSTEEFDNSVKSLGEDFEALLTMGELIDRLSIVNFKLFTLKNQVMQTQEDKNFCAWAAVEDVKLVMERARLKKCIDSKLLSIIKRVNNGDISGGINPEVKKYG